VAAPTLLKGMASINCSPFLDPLPDPTKEAPLTALKLHKFKPYLP